MDVNKILDIVHSHDGDAVDLAKSLGGALEKRRAQTAKKRAGGQELPKSKFMPNVPRAVHADGGWCDAEHFKLGGDVEPKKTVKAYKLFQTDKKHPGKIFPLFVNSDIPVPLGQWVDADHPYSFKGPNGLDYIPATTGGSVPIDHLPIETRQEMVERGLIKNVNTKTRKAVAARPGWHAGDLPVATHIGKGGSPPTYRPDDQVWAEVEMPNDVDWQSEANKRASRTKSGEIDVSTAHITDQVPHGGHYRYKTNPNMTGNWMISGSMKVNRILGDDEVQSINDEAGVADLPRIKNMNEGGPVYPTAHLVEHVAKAEGGEIAAPPAADHEHIHPAMMIPGVHIRGHEPIFSGRK